MTAITEFRGYYRFLSNFYPCKVHLDMECYPSVEHAYQAAKTVDHESRKVFQDRNLKASKAKSMGRSIKLRDGWDDIKIGVMRNLLVDKFERDHDLAIRLASTGDAELVEGNWWGDRFWGVCDGVGENWLGKLLMEVRSNL